MSSMIIKVNSAADIRNAGDYLMHNPDFLRIDNSLFSVNKITTLLKPEFDIEDDDSIRSESFGFSYTDTNVKGLYFVTVCYEPTSFFEYMKVSQQLNTAQLNELAAKEFEYLNEHRQIDEDDTTEEQEWGTADANIDKMMFNEALVYILKGINKDDCEQIKNDVWDKFLNWRRKKLEINNLYHDTLNKLYEVLLDIKTIGR